MDNNSIHTTVPQLRFPDFANEREWEETKVGDVINTLTPPKKLNSSEYEKTGKYPIIDQSQNFICGYSDDEDALMNHNNEDLIVFGDHTCVLKFVNFPFIQGADGIKIIKSKDSNKLIESFLFQSLLNNPVVSREYKRHFSELKEKEFCFPHSIVEQQKIASCLFSMDAYISSTKEKLELLKIYKKGMMQKLFPAKGKQRPELRFKEFEIEGQWVENRLGKVAEVFQGYGFPEKLQGKTKGKYPFIKVSDISVTINKGSKYICNAVNYVDEEDLDVIKASPFPIGTIIFAKIGEAIRLNRKVILKQESLIDNNVAGVKAIPDLSDDEFLYYIMFMINLVNYAGGVVPAVKKTSIEEIEVLLPPDRYLLEQRKIADCLNSIDDMINQYTNKVALLELYKKGLMQQMFPTSK